MQLISRYLVNNVTTIIANDAGFATEYSKVYTRQLKVYRGIDNKLQFRLLNADQKPLNVTTYTPKFVAFDENGRQVIQHDGVLNQTDDSSATRGMFTVTITENDLLNITRQYLRYNVYLIDNNSNKTITYSDDNFDNDGTIFVDDYAFPGPTATFNVTSFTKDTGKPGVDDDVWYSESISAEPAINGNEALHTAAIYTNNYIGIITVQGTLENQITSTTNWANISTLILGGTETEPVPVNFNGIFSFIRFKSSSDPSNKITKILVRN
tara:strand:+ start:5027 stop:5827 length:801 start_codon:yes stop_codon:yes gene_type:complete